MLLSALLIASTLLMPLASSRCSPVIRHFNKPAHHLTLWARTGRDSVFVGKEYGQVFDLVRVDGATTPAVGAAPRVVLVWWGLTASCERVRDTAWTPVPTGEALVVAQPRPEGQWIQGMPTFDILLNELYIPARAQQQFPRSTPLGIGEYWPLFAMVPAAELSPADARPYWERVLAWGRANPTRASRTPARQLLCHAKDRLELLRRGVDTSQYLFEERC
ncbi:MAG: hypothetical protein K2R93_15940 [Gemmatimonadaceae bacterium]|nr:hypothetical protein [Gemmatimonadaceae bacterium]